MWLGLWGYMIKLSIMTWKLACFPILSWLSWIIWMKRNRSRNSETIFINHWSPSKRLKKISRSICICLGSSVCQLLICYRMIKFRDLLKSSSNWRRWSLKGIRVRGRSRGRWRGRRLCRWGVCLHFGGLKIRRSLSWRNLFRRRSRVIKEWRN